MSTPLKTLLIIAAATFLIFSDHITTTVVVVAKGGPPNTSVKKKCCSGESAEEIMSYFKEYAVPVMNDAIARAKPGKGRVYGDIMEIHSALAYAECRGGSFSADECKQCLDSAKDRVFAECPKMTGGTIDLADCSIGYVLHETGYEQFPTCEDNNKGL